MIVLIKVTMEEMSIIVTGEEMGILYLQRQSWCGYGILPTSSSKHQAV
jgi:hypothetical protein